MTVQELIAELNKIKDKNLVVYCNDMFGSNGEVLHAEVYEGKVYIS